MGFFKKRAHEAVFIGLLHSLIAIFILMIFLPMDWISHNPYPDFARRWDGGCTGWSRNLAIWDIGENILLWITYCIMGNVLYRLHPLPRLGDHNTALTLFMICSFIIGCGFKHLLDAFTIIYPNYYLSIAAGYILSFLSLASLYHISKALIEANKNVLENRKTLEEYVRKYH